MKNLLFILLASMSVMTVFAQDYNEEEILALNDSLNTNPEYVSQWCDAEINKATKNPDVYLLKSMYLSKKEDYKGAIKYIDRALKYTKDDSRISKAGLFYLRGMTYLFTEDYDKAIKSFSNSIKLDSTLIDPYKERVELYFKKGEYDLAAKDAKKIIDLEPKFENVLFYARCEAKQGNYEEALESFNFVIENLPNCSEAYQYRAETYRKLGEIKSAINDYIKFMSITGAAIDDYLQFIALGGDYSLDHLVALSEIDYDYTINKLSNLIITDENKNTWLGVRARLYIEIEEYDLALSDLNLLVELINNETIFTLYHKYLCYDGLSNYLKQVEVLTKLIDIQEKPDSYALAMRGVAYENLADFEKAINDLNSSLEIEPDNYLNYLRRGWIYEKNGDLEKALKDYDTSIILGPNLPITRLKRAQILLEAKDTLKATEDLKIVLELDSVSNIRAFALVLLGNEEEAIDFMNSKLEKELNKSNLYDLACIYSLANRKEEAIDTLGKAVKLGYKNYNHIKYDRDFINIREEQGFKDILASMNQAKVLKLFEGFGK